MPRRQVDSQPPDFALSNVGQFGGDDFKVPVHRQVGLRVEILEAASGEGCEVVPQQELVLGAGQVFEHYGLPFENRDLSCASTFSSASLNSAVSGEAGSVWPSRSRTMSSRIFIARKSAVAERLTSCFMIA